MVEVTQNFYSDNSTTRLWKSLPSNYVYHVSVGQFKHCIHTFPCT